MAHKNVSPKMGIDFTAVDTVARFNLGEMAESDKGGRFMYLKASAAITGAGYTSQIAADQTAAMVTTTTATGKKGDPVGVPLAAVAQNSFGWFQVYGYCEGIRGGASCAAQVALNTTATAGLLDDDATSGARVIDGITIDTAVGSGGAANAIGWLSHPTVGATL